MIKDTDKPKIKAIAPWFGGKRAMAPRIVAELGEHRSYWEPFCGSMAVLLAKPKSTFETVNDLNGDLINLARVIQDVYIAPMLYRWLKRTLCSEELFHSAAGRTRQRGHTPPSHLAELHRAYDYFIASWLGRNGVAGTQSYNQGFCARYTQNGGHAAKRWASAVDSIPAWRRRMREVTILCKDGLELTGKIADEVGTAIYADPPYLVKGAKYIHDFEEHDHIALAGLLGRFRNSRVVVSYYDDPHLDELYPPARWTKVKCYRHKALSTQNKRGGTADVAPEVLLINGESFTEPKGGLFGSSASMHITKNKKRNPQ